MDTAEFAECIGLCETIAGVPPVQALSPKRIDASTPNLYSGQFGFGAFPFHTDLAHWFVPPRFILLRCRRGDARVFTSVLRWDRARHGVPRDVLNRARFRPRCAMNGRVHLLPFTQIVSDHALWRWDSVFLKPDNREAAALTGHLAQMQTSGEKVVLRDCGDTLVIDNWRAMHGRSAVPAGASSRLVERAYLQEIGIDGQGG